MLLRDQCHASIMLLHQAHVTEIESRIPVRLHLAIVLSSFHRTRMIIEQQHNATCMDRRRITKMRIVLQLNQGHRCLVIFLITRVTCKITLRFSSPRTIRSRPEKYHPTDNSHLMLIMVIMKGEMQQDFTPSQGYQQDLRNISRCLESLHIRR